MGIRGIRQRVLEQLAFRYWLKNKKRSPKQNWAKAEKLLFYIDKRKSLMIKIMEKK